jgi:hypothetical protein
MPGRGQTYSFIKKKHSNSVSALQVHSIRALRNLSDEQLEKLGFQLGEIGEIKAVLTETSKSKYFSVHLYCYKVHGIKPLDVVSNYDTDYPTTKNPRQNAILIRFQCYNFDGLYIFKIKTNKLNCKL